jgi:DNA-binding NarL/FixJ family response regulator
VKSGKSWVLPSGAPKPEDRRYDDPAAADAKVSQNPPKTDGALSARDREVTLRAREGRSVQEIADVNTAVL